MVTNKSLILVSYLVMIKKGGDIMATQKRVTTESINKAAERIKKQKELLKQKQAKKHLQDLEELATVVLKLYKAQTGREVTVEELTAYYTVELEQMTKKEV